MERERIEVGLTPRESIDGTRVGVSRPERVDERGSLITGSRDVYVVLDDEGSRFIGVKGVPVDYGFVGDLSPTNVSLAHDSYSQD